MQKEIQLFKPHLNTPQTYKGGKSKSEITSNKKVYKLSSNENLLGSSPKAIAAIQKHIHSLNEYPDRKDDRLRGVLSEFYEGKLSASQFITTNSGVGMLELIIRAFLGKGLECIVSNPSFAPYMMFTKKVEGNVVDIPLVGDNFDLDVQGIVAAINDRTRLIFLTTPNNPTGTHIAKSQIDELIAQLPAHVILVIDEVYFQFAEAADYTRALPYVLEGKNVIGVNSFSKAYGLAGLRAGYAYSTAKIAEYVSLLRRPFMLNTFVIEGVIAALGDNEFIERTVGVIREGKKYLYPELDKLKVKYWKSEANFILMKPDMQDIVFEERMLEEGIMVRPAAGFGAPGCIRVTIGTEEANRAFIAALKKVVD
ncbi:MAG: histidinol-phosphate transaminase [Chitinophagales bacterium]